MSWCFLAVLRPRGRLSLTVCQETRWMIQKSVPRDQSWGSQFRRIIQGQSLEDLSIIHPGISHSRTRHARVFTWKASHSGNQSPGIKGHPWLLPCDVCRRPGNWGLDRRSVRHMLITQGSSKRPRGSVTQRPVTQGTDQSPRR